MATPNRGSSDVDRRASGRDSIPFSRPDDIEEDIYDVEAMGVSDGFRPANASSGHNRMTSRRPTPPPRPSSATKPNNIDNFALRHDGPMFIPPIEPVATGSSSGSSTIVTRESTTSTDTRWYMRAESPYTGPEGPSHPYQMYPQHTRIARTASIATTSTIQPPSERSYTGPIGPAHPYGMYPQNTVTVPEGDEGLHGPMLNSNIPVGFPGLAAGAQYQRRFGPDGEDAADLIGPDGHTEPLPPYSQHPDEAFARKARLPDVEGAGGIGLATRNPEFESRDDLRSSQSRQSTQSVLSETSTHHVNGAAAQLSEKPAEPRWKVIARRKVCGLIPIWVLVLVAAVILLFAIILGSVLGALIAKHNAQKTSVAVHPRPPPTPASNDQYITVTTTYDASPMPTLPTGLPLLPLGSFSLPVVNPASSSTTCVDSAHLSSAWQCNMPIAGNILATIIPVSGNPNTSSYALSFSLNNSLSTFSYGTQPPVVKTPQVLRLVSDSDDSNLGPAWFFQAPYNKLVILPSSALNPSDTKREVSIPESHLEPRGYVAQAGDKPWFCYWNNTLLETFIYINSTSNAGAQQASAAAPDASATASPTQSLYARGYGYSTLTTTPTSPTPTSTTKGSSSSSASSSASTASSTSDPLNIIAALPTMYPKIVKIEERRVIQSPQAYCVQMVISQNGMMASPYLNSQGQQTVLYVNETESANQLSKRDDAEVNLSPRGESGLFSRQGSNSCSCEWRFT